ncbi:hypothetical protein [Antiquaquibacter soli]|uniref:Uncharacterized protein n=1 Tax=Antiquaquibacter soli TaxID=3064523 RepID=A0ABT9BQN3_9MICO|nr:hypothetical protein [Protaetiibacter sp. WY-16]MDO7882742.1 hypothetical protein [Protaetiibacter sp. WY-16]
MGYHRLVISNNPYVLKDAETKDALAASIVEAVRSGGDFVHVPLDGQGLDVLVTPATPVLIEPVEPIEPRDARRTGTIDFDLDWIDFDSPS